MRRARLARTVTATSVVLLATLGAAGGTAEAQPIAPSGQIATQTPAFTWSASESAAYYRLWVDDALQQGRIDRWYSPSEAGCASGSGVCAVSPGVVLAPGAARFYVAEVDEEWTE
jgi:hypothetical protein